MKKKHWIFIIILITLGAGFLVWYNCLGEESNLSLDNYVPNDDFKEAYDALESRVQSGESSGQTYDLEETIRIINGLEVAQSQSNDFYTYLEHMARQDYSKVPAEVVEAKEHLLPIFQKMAELGKQYKELSDIWSLAQNAANQGATTLAEDLNPIATIASIFGGDAIGAVSVSQSLSKAKTAMFDKYAEDQKLKADLKKQIDELRMAYIDYLGQYAPIYMKYMKEWDRLCLSKDKAYLDIYAGRYTEACNAAQEVLSQYPDNKEGLLLKSLALIEINKGQQNALPTIISPEEFEGSESSESFEESSQRESSLGGALDFLGEADELLDRYISLYPSRTAPALVLKGLLNLQIGNETQAMSYFDQASVEYPRQAQDLIDMLDSYRCRTYLDKSPEGKYLLRLYRSTMEGYGLFSPNLLKAKYYSLQGDYAKSKEEIFNHFFRRGNQGVYDCLLSDMQFCEENLYDSFRQLLLEQSFIDVEVEPTVNWYLSDKDDEVKVTINNRSDIDLENVRLFLCIHYTDMYNNEYDVQKIPAVNLIPHHDKTEVGVVPLTYPDKTYNDITRIRAIAMTDDKICWLDEVNYKIAQAKAQSTKLGAGGRVQGADLPSQISNLPSQISQFLSHFNIDSKTLVSVIENGIKITYGKTGTDIISKAKQAIGVDNETLEISLPRIISILDPIVSINPIGDTDKAILPTDSYISGSDVRIKFKYRTTDGEDIPLYIYTSYLSFRITIHFDGTTPQVKSVEII